MQSLKAGFLSALQGGWRHPAVTTVAEGHNLYLHHIPFHTDGLMVL